jgi:hypothetical protein
VEFKYLFFFPNFRNDAKYPHLYKHDFKITIFFPDKFKELWNIYGANEIELLESLTHMNLKGFKNPAKSQSWMAHSWDGKYFLKTVKIEPKKFFHFIKVEDTLEKDFFFDVTGNRGNFMWVLEIFLFILIYSISVKTRFLLKIRKIAYKTVLIFIK